MVDSLWGEDFVIPETKKVAKKIVKKISEPKDLSQVVTKAVKSKTLSIKEKLSIIRENVVKILGRYKENTLVIKTRGDLTDYINKAIENGIIAVDTETNNSLDPITCKLMGPCLYTPGLKQAYIPINHVNPDTLERLDWQLTEKDIAEELSRLTDTKIVMHNGKFDYQVIKCTCAVALKIYWDTMIGAKVLDENEKSAGLKQQYIDKIDSTQEKYSIDHLFEDIEYALVDPEIFALYAAQDANMTLKLYEWQKEKFDIKENKKLASLFLDIEMPIVEVAAEMELAGVEIDKEYADRLSKKYHKQLDLIDAKIAEEVKQYDAQIKAWRNTEEANFHPLSTKPGKDGTFKEQKSKNEQLEDPVNMSSPSQLAILLYDILKIKPVDKKQPRGTGEPILEKIDLPFCKTILERRGLLKLINTYIDKLPECVNPKSGRLHAHFNQYGAQTGRFSSSDPNLQNIPSGNKSIRMLFRASEGNTLIGSDFSQQEVRLLAEYADDENMIQSYKEDKDIYASVASIIYKNKYEDNKEFWPDGTPNPDGKKRRSFTKSIVLGLMYQRGAASIAEQINQPIEKAQEIIDDFFKSFPRVRNYVDDTQAFARENGYVEDFWGRRRRLPDIQLPKYKITDLKAKEGKFNPLLECTNLYSGKDNPNVEKYKKLLENIKYRKDYEKIKQDALKEDVEIHDNSGFIAQAERQSVNARIQGGASTLTKIAMIKVHNDPILKELGFKMLLAVHDELIGEGPKENAEAIAERLTHVMKHAGEPTIKINFKCDPTIEDHWYATDYSDSVHKHFYKLKDEGLSCDDILTNIYEEFSECLPSTLDEMLKDVKA